MAIFSFSRVQVKIKLTEKFAGGQVMHIKLKTKRTTYMKYWSLDGVIYQLYVNIPGLSILHLWKLQPQKLLVNLKESYVEGKLNMLHNILLQ